MQISRCVGDRNQFLGQDDPISLSLEYYQVHLDTTDVNQKPTPPTQTFLTSGESESESVEIGEGPNSEKVTQPENSDSAHSNSEINGEQCRDNEAVNFAKCKENDSHSVETDSKDCDKRYLQCPAAVSMKHLQKFIRMKFGLTGDHRVSVIYSCTRVLHFQIDILFLVMFKSVDTLFMVKPIEFFLYQRAIA